MASERGSAVKVACLECGVPIKSEHINIETGWVKCDQCDSVFQLKDLRPEDAEAIERPYNARCEVDSSVGELILHIPKGGMRGELWGLLGFSIFWLAFVAFWTAAALGVAAGEKPELFNYLFAAFSLPFWIVGLSLLGKVVWESQSQQLVRIDRSELLLLRRCLMWRSKKSIRREEVQRARRQEKSRFANSRRQNVDWLPGVEIVYRGGTFVLPVDSEAENIWLVKVINDFLGQHP